MEKTENHWLMNEMHNENEALRLQLAKAEKAREKDGEIIAATRKLLAYRDNLGYGLKDHVPTREVEGLIKRLEELL